MNQNSSNKKQIYQNVTRKNLLENFEKYNVFHFSGHATAIDNEKSWRLFCCDSELEVIELLKLMNNTFLVNLAGCNTATQEALKTGDLISMAGVFAMNHVPVFIGNLFPVYDEMALNFSKKFYDYWFAKNNSVSESVQHAMLDNKKLFSNPYIWGGQMVFC